MSSRNRAPLEPQRHDGRQRVAELLQAAAAVIQERGFEATKMAEIAARADAKIGSLYRFFPNKDAVAEALMRQYAEALQRSTTPSMRPPPVLRRKNSPISSSI